MALGVGLADAPKCLGTEAGLGRPTLADHSPDLNQAWGSEYPGYGGGGHPLGKRCVSALGEAAALSGQVLLSWPSEWLLRHLYESLEVPFSFFGLPCKGMLLLLWHISICPIYYQEVPMLPEWMGRDRGCMNKWHLQTCPQPHSLQCQGLNRWQSSANSQAGYSFCFSPSGGGRGSRNCLMKCL